MSQGNEKFLNLPCLALHDQEKAKKRKQPNCKSFCHFVKQLGSTSVYLKKVTFLNEKDEELYRKVNEKGDWVILGTQKELMGVKWSGQKWDM